MKKHCLYIIVLSIACVWCQPAQAQLFRNLFRKEKKKPARKSPEVVIQKPRPAKKEKIDYPQTKYKDRYRVDLLLPLYLDELVKNGSTTFRDRVPDKALAGKSFYEGVKLAADTLRDIGIDLYVHDINAKDLGLDQLISKNLLDSSDLLIGALQGPQVAHLAQYAKKKQINFISIFSPNDNGVRDNPYFTIIQPTLHGHCEWIFSAARRKFPRQKLIMYHRSDVAVDEGAWKYMTDGNNSAIEEVNCNKLPSRVKLTAIFSRTEVNPIIMPVLDIQYADSLIAQLSRDYPDYRFEVYGMPSWTDMQSLKKADAYTNVAVNFPAPFYYDATTASGTVLSMSYKDAFGGKPNEWVFRGYETFYWYANLLKKYGTIFNPKMSDNSAAIFTDYEIKPRWDKEHNLYYNENRHIYLYHYLGGSSMIENQ